MLSLERGGLQALFISICLFMLCFQSSIAQESHLKSRNLSSVETSELLHKRDAFDSVLAGEVPRDQCRWTNCGQSCPKDWTHVHRRDPDKNSVTDRMRDITACDNDEFRSFCCPPGPEPWCQWKHLNKGKCNPRCGKDEWEIGSTKAGCTNGHSRLACCRTDDNSDVFPGKKEVNGMKIWKKCTWHGEEASCASDEGTCKKYHPKEYATLLMSWLGSGATKCEKSVGRGKKPERAQRALCCEPPTLDNRLENCAWTEPNRDGHCDTACPSGTNKIALDDDSGVCKSGTRAYCCSAYSTTEATDKESEEYLIKMLDEWTKDPQCPNSNGLDNKLKTRDTFELPDPKLSLVKSTTAFLFLLGTTGLITDPKTKLVISAWNREIEPKWPGLNVDNVRSIYNRPAIAKVVAKSEEAATYSLDCRMDQWSKWVQDDGLKKKATCDVRILKDEDKKLFRDEDDIEDDSDLGPEKGGAQEEIQRRSSLERRVGAARDFTVNLGNGRTVPIRSSTYINGDNGRNLEDATHNRERFYIHYDENDCTTFALSDDASNDVPMQAEHIIELQTVPNFIEFMVRSSIPAVDDRSGSPVLSQPLNNHHHSNDVNADMIIRYFTEPFARWEAEYSENSVPITELFNRIGSELQPDDMVNLEGPVNNMKARIWSMRAHIANDRWARDFAGSANANQFALAMESLQQIRTVWYYLNDERVIGHAQQVYGAVSDLLREFERLYRQQRQDEGHRDPGALHLADMWRDYMNGHMARMVAHSRAWQIARLETLRTTWQNHVMDMWGEFFSDDRDPTAAELAEAYSALDAIEWFINNLDADTDFPQNIFR